MARRACTNGGMPSFTPKHGPIDTPRQPAAAAVRHATGLAMALAACLIAGPVCATAPPMVVVQPAPSIAEPLSTVQLPEAAPVLPTAALAAVPAVPDVSAVSAVSVLAPVDAGLATGSATEPAAPVTPLAVDDSAATWPRPILAGLPLLAMVIGAGLVAVGWRRARR